jgi:PncC family amidohydrolase
MRKIITENKSYAVYNLHNKTLEVYLTNLVEVQIGNILRERKLKLALAESCTGGLVGHRITDVPGSSEFFWGRIVSYAYEAKVALLDVSWDTLKTHGAVSRETVLEMARGACKLLSTDIGVSVSGIAGPGGGTAEKPVGTTWIGLAASDREWAKKYQFYGDRAQNKAFAAEAALQLLLDYLEGRLEKVAT